VWAKPSTTKSKSEGMNSGLQLVGSEPLKQPGSIATDNQCRGVAYVFLVGEFGKCFKELRQCLRVRRVDLTSSHSNAKQGSLDGLPVLRVRSSWEPGGYRDAVLPFGIPGSSSNGGSNTHHLALRRRDTQEVTARLEGGGEFVTPCSEIGLEIFRTALILSWEFNLLPQRL
jgi:hypothetical protein